MQTNKPKIAFTLAEVLITLAIIGVVAALTIPTLMHNYRKKLIETRLSNANAILNQALKLSEVENGPISTWNFANDNLELNKLYIYNYMKHSRDETTGWFQSPNGVRSVIDFYGVNGTRVGVIMLDLGITKEKKQGVDRFDFSMVSYNGKSRITAAESYEAGESWGLSCYALNNDAAFRSKSRQYCITGEDENIGRGNLYCAALIECNNWKIPDDYPIKF